MEGSIRTLLLSFSMTECFYFVAYFIMSYNKTYENEHTLQMLNKVGKIRLPEGDMYFMFDKQRIIILLCV